ncbi:DUF2249 domain-containing protein [Glutamicibacter protophormiae]|uniref:DUF2249 domain-containing protein n=1 Tax=Glutamicibacter protophormiae TaxID=37930 RepID=UPI00331AAA88
MAERIEISGSREEALKQQAPGGCACGGHDEDLPQLDVQAIPHAVRHAAIFGALDSLRPGAGLVLSATHDPLPLLAIKCLYCCRNNDNLLRMSSIFGSRWRVQR